MKRGPKRKSLEERFWLHVQKPTKCWLWIGAKNRKGEYGQIYTVGKKRQQAHRVAYRIYHGRIPRGKKVLHTCDVPLCVRREHLYAGTSKNNTRDMISRGRAKWTGAGIAKLTVAQRERLVALAILGWSTRSLAKRFGVSIATVKYWQVR